MNGGNCTLALKQIKCICNHEYIGNLCQYGIDDSSLLFSQYYDYIDQLLNNTNSSSIKTNFTNSDYNNFDDLNTLINQKPETFANMSFSLKIANLTSIIGFLIFRTSFPSSE